MRRFFLSLCAAVLTIALTAGSAAAQGLCDKPRESCGRLVSAECLSKFGAGATPLESTGDCAPALATYTECLATVADACGDAAAAAPTPQADASVAVGKRQELRVSFVSCALKAADLVCAVTIESAIAEDVVAYVYAKQNGVSRIVTKTGEQINARSVRMADATHSQYLRNIFVTAVPIRVELTFAGAGLKAGDRLAMLEVALYPETTRTHESARFRGAPIQ